MALEPTSVHAADSNAGDADGGRGGGGDGGAGESNKYHLLSSVICQATH